MINIGYWHLLLERDFLVTAFSAIAAFATILTLGLPYMKADALEGRMKAVSERRDELRQKQRDAFAQAGRRGQLRSTPIGFMKSTVENLKLEKLLESPGMKEKLARAGYRGQGPVIAFMFFRFLMPPVVFIGALIYVGLAAWALMSGDSTPHRLTAIWCGASALISLSLVSRRVADFVTHLLFRDPAPGRTRRLTARIAVLLLLLPVPTRLMAPEIMAMLRDSGTALIDPAGLVSQLLGEIVIALAGVGLFVRRDWSATRERLGLVAMRPSQFGVVVAGLVAAIVLNTGMTWIQQHQFPELWKQDGAMVQMMASSLPVWSTLLLGVSAGVGEEILFRGALQPRMGVLLTAILFACLHVQYTWFGMVTVGVLGALLGTIRARTNTTTAILVHGMYDIYAALTSG